MCRSMPMMLSFLLGSYSHSYNMSEVNIWFICVLTFEDTFESLELYFCLWFNFSLRNFEKSMNFKVAVFLGDFPGCHCVWGYACGRVCLLKHGLTLVWAWTHSSPFALAPENWLLALIPCLAYSRSWQEWVTVLLDV